MMERTLHIGVDATSWQNNRGFGRFTRELVTALAARNTGFRYTLLFDQVPSDGLPANVGILSAATQKTLNESAVGTTSRSVNYLWQLGRVARNPRDLETHQPHVRTAISIFLQQAASTSSRQLMRVYPSGRLAV